MFKNLPFLTVVVLVLLAPVSAAPAANPDDDLVFLDGLSLIVLDTEDIASLHFARRMIQSYGGTIAVMSPPSTLIGWVPFDSREGLIGKAGIREIYYTEVLPGEVETTDNRTAGIIEFFNAAVRGDIAREYRDYVQTTSPEGTGMPRKPDVLLPESIDKRAYLENLLSAGLDPDALVEEGLLVDPSSPAAMGNSDYMTGTVALTIFFVESDGSRSDPDLYTWTPEAMQRYLNGVTTGLVWWANRAVTHGDCWVSFLINYHSGADPRCQQWVEPILHPSSWESYWIPEIMANFGYASGTRWDRVNAFNTWQRSYYQANRSYSAFVPFNPSPAPAFFPDGHTAYAYWYGPYAVLLFRVPGWTTPQVFAHESGHIFGACDEYDGGCGTGDCASICSNGTPNANCESCNPNSRDCMMKANSFSLCAYTPKHVGWNVTSPCSPPEPPFLPSPTLVSISPPYGKHGMDVAVTVTGKNFYPGVELDLGSDVFVHAIDLVGQTTINAFASILMSAPPGPRDVRVANRDGRYTTVSGAFEIRQTSRHYYSPAGSDHYPYVTPVDAATSLQDAINATYDGDTLFVVTRTFDSFSIFIGCGLLLHGGWNNDFTQRNLETGKTVLNLNGNVTFTSTAGAAGLDGFLIQNGTGAYDVIPFEACFGGAVRFVGGTAVVANCEIRSSSAGGTSDYGVGGAIFADGCTVDINNNFIHDNSAAQGGALYLRGCTGTIENNAISENSLNASFQSHLGAGIAILNSTSLTLVDNTLVGNRQAAEGGGIYVQSSSGVMIVGGALEGNAASFLGGGVAFRSSSGHIDGVGFTGNTSSGLGGGLSAMDASRLTVTGATFRSNTAIIGGGLHAATGECSIQHSLFTENTGASTAGAIVISNLEYGGVTGNTIDGNSSVAVGGIVVTSSRIGIFNNIISNSAGTGVSCDGTPLATDYNLVWNNSGGDYSGCTPGEGSLAGDPLFVDPLANDYHLGLHSPAIDAGLPGPLFADPDGSRGDMGIYGSHVFPMDQPSHPKNLTASLKDGFIRLSWDTSPEGDIANYAIYGDQEVDFVPSASNFVTLVAGTVSTVTLDPPADSLYYRISAVDTSGYGGGYSLPTFSSPATTVGDDPIRYALALRQNVPNPFNPATQISYELPVRAPVTLYVYDATGRIVRRLVDSIEGPGQFSVTWSGRNDAGHPVASGVYFCRLDAGGRVETKKMVLLR